VRAQVELIVVKCSPLVLFDDCVCICMRLCVCVCERVCVGVCVYG